jgi:D-alanyl-D-alanine carboxypeptidase
LCAAGTWIVASGLSRVDSAGDEAQTSGSGGSILAQRGARMMKFLLAVGLTAAANGALAQEDAAAAQSARTIDSVMRVAYPADKPGASLLAVYHNRVVLRRGYGLAQVGPARPVEPATIFRIGSMTKQFTAVAVLQLVAAGKLRLDARLETVLPNTPPAWRDITIEQLLNHTSGLAAGTEQPDSLDGVPRTVAELLELSQSPPLVFPPGTNWAYSNTGYIVLGAVIERVSGLRYPTYVKQRIAAPAALHVTGYDAGEDSSANRARGYVVQADDTVKSAGFLHMSQVFSAGALTSNVDDLWQWERQLAGGHLVSHGLLERAWSSTQLPDGRQTGYGFGWFSSEIAGHVTHEHGGAINGFSSYALAVPDEQLYVFVLTNRQLDPRSPALATDVTVRIARLLLGDSKRPPAAVAVQGDLSVLAGSYRVNPAVKRVISVEGSVLYSQTPGRPRFTLVPVGLDHFMIAESETQLFFVRDAKGQVIGMRSRPRLGTEQFSPREQAATPPMHTR